MMKAKLLFAIIIPVISGIKINAQIPIAAFKGAPTSVCAGQAVIFTDTSKNAPTSWLWTFSGGSISSSTFQNPIVVYSNAGTYTVKLTASNVNGKDSITKTNYRTGGSV